MKITMKKLTALLLALALVFSLGVVAFADNGISGSNTVTLTYDEAEAYTITIPSTVEVSTTSLGKDIKVSDARISEGNKLTVSVASEQGYKLNCEGSKIPYTVTCPVPDDEDCTLSGTSAQEILTVSSGNTTGEVTLTFATTSDDIAAATKAGEHKDKLTFSAGISKAVNEIKFTIAQDNNVYVREGNFYGEFTAVEGMTWSEWADSSYNTTDWAKLLDCSLPYDTYQRLITVNGEQATAIICGDWNNVIEADKTYKPFNYAWCFAAGTQVTTDLEGNTKNIEDFVVGDTVVSYDLENDEYYLAEVVRTKVSTTVETVYDVTLEDGTTVTMNKLHPVLTTEGFKAIDNEDYAQLTIGDTVKTVTGNFKVVSIDECEEQVTVYNIDVKNVDEVVDDDTVDTFIANGIIAHNGY